MKMPHNTIEPHAHLLRRPDKGTSIYKVMFLNHFLDAINKGYLYFNRVNTYNDDIKDSDVPTREKDIYKNIKFKYNQDFSVLDYYNTFRSRAYACCFSTKNIPYIWDKYGGREIDKKVCLVFDSNKLISSLNKNYPNLRLPFNKKLFHNIFDINYGLINYGNFESDILTKERFSNPIEYIFFKDVSYSRDAEFRVSLSTIGFGTITIDNSIFKFKKSLKMSFDYKKEIKLGTVKEILLSGNYNNDILKKLSKLGIYAKSKEASCEKGV